MADGRREKCFLQEKKQILINQFELYKDVVFKRDMKRLRASLTVNVQIIKQSFADAAP